MAGKRYNWHKNWHWRNNCLIHSSGLTFSLIMAKSAQTDKSTYTLETCPEALEVFSKNEQGRGVPPHDIENRLNRLKKEAVECCEYLMFKKVPAPNFTYQKNLYGGDPGDKVEAIVVTAELQAWAFLQLSRLKDHLGPSLPNEAILTAKDHLTDVVCHVSMIAAGKDGDHRRGCIKKTDWKNILSAVGAIDS